MKLDSWNFPRQRDFFYQDNGRFSSRNLLKVHFFRRGVGGLHLKSLTLMSCYFCWETSW